MATLVVSLVNSCSYIIFVDVSLYIYERLRLVNYVALNTSVNILLELSSTLFLTTESSANTMAEIIGLSASAPYAVASLFLLVVYFVIYPLMAYMRDPKGK